MESESPENRKNLFYKIKSLPISMKITLLVTIFPGIITALTGVYLSRIGAKHMEASLINQGRTLYRQLELVRHWNASFGGVYVLKKPGIKTNPYLYQVGPSKNSKPEIEPEIKDTKGRTYTLKNPALMTHELSELAEKESSIHFKITSLKYLNPENKPDEFEKNTLRRFEDNHTIKEEFAFSKFKNKQSFRYMAPLVVKETCLVCHGFQGYKTGDIRGGISIVLPVDELLADQKESTVNIILTGILVYLVIVITLIFSLRYLITEPLLRLKEYTLHMGEFGKGHETMLPDRTDEIGILTQALVSANHELTRQQAELEKKAAHLDQKTRIDPLTNVFNRYHFTKEIPGLFKKVKSENFALSLLMIDLDHFKKINDKYGHATGDKVLRLISRKLQESCRNEDMVVRFGGEEFVIVLPGLDLQKAEEIAERIRDGIEKTPARIRGTGEIATTISIGIASAQNHDTIEGLLLCADKALYKAKKNGRNRVESGCLEA